MSTKFKDSKLHEKRRRLNYETPSLYINILSIYSHSIVAGGFEEMS